MDKSVLISMRPKWCEKITSGEKTIEVRKTRPKLDTPFRCYIYCTVEMAGYDALWVLDTPTREKYSLMAVSAYLETPEGANKGNGKVIGLTFQQVQKYERGLNRIGAGDEVDASLALDFLVQRCDGYPVNQPQPAAEELTESENTEEEASAEEENEEISVPEPVSG